MARALGLSGSTRSVPTQTDPRCRRSGIVGFAALRRRGSRRNTESSSLPTSDAAKGGSRLERAGAMLVVRFRRASSPTD